MKTKKTLTEIVRVTSVIIVYTTSTLTRLMQIVMVLEISVTTVTIEESEFIVISCMSQ